MYVEKHQEGFVAARPMKVTEIITTKVCLYDVDIWGLGLGNWYSFNHLYVCVSTHQSRRRDACPYMGS